MESDGANPVQITLTAKPDHPIACTLGPVDAQSQVEEWRSLSAKANEITALPSGVRMVFPSALTRTVADLAQREQTCCSFLSMSVLQGAETVALEISSPNSDALPVIGALAGIELS